MTIMICLAPRGCYQVVRPVFSCCCYCYGNCEGQTTHGAKAAPIKRERTNDVKVGTRGDKGRRR